MDNNTIFILLSVHQLVKTLITNSIKILKILIYSVCQWVCAHYLKRLMAMKNQIGSSIIKEL